MGEGPQRPHSGGILSRVARSLRTDRWGAFQEGALARGVGAGGADLARPWSCGPRRQEKGRWREPWARAAALWPPVAVRRAGGRGMVLALPFRVPFRVDRGGGGSPLLLYSFIYQYH